MGDEQDRTNETAGDDQPEVRDAEASGDPRAREIDVTITYLEMRSPPPHLGNRPHRADVSGIIRAEQPTSSFYRYLYNTVGAPWLWYERRDIAEDDLRAILDDEGVELFVLYVQGTPAGFLELDGRQEGEIEFAYFGLIPEFIGRGLGPYFLNWGLENAWSRSPQRVWLHTCDLDHPKALQTYQRSGFEVYDREVVRIPDPRHRVGEGPTPTTTPPPEGTE